MRGAITEAKNASGAFDRKPFTKTQAAASVAAAGDRTYDLGGGCSSALNDVIVIPFNDTARALSILDAHKAELARYSPAHFAQVRERENIIGDFSS